MRLRINLANSRNNELFIRLRDLVLDPFIIHLRQLFHLNESILILLILLLIVTTLEAFTPEHLVQIQQHFLLKIILAVVDGDGVIVPVQTTYKGLNRRLLQQPNIRGRLPGFNLLHGQLRINEPKGIDDNFSLH